MRHLGRSFPGSCLPFCGTTVKSASKDTGHQLWSLPLEAHASLRLGSTLDPQALSLPTLPLSCAACTGDKPCLPPPLHSLRAWALSARVGPSNQFQVASLSSKLWNRVSFPGTALGTLPTSCSAQPCPEAGFSRLHPPASLLGAFVQVYAVGGSTR